MFQFIRKVATFPIRVYQMTLSPDHGPLRHLFHDGYCMYYPSCSEYTRQSILKKGVIAGILFGGWRILRCNPWGKGGVDKP
jgi:uncharacterized protein